MGISERTVEKHLAKALLRVAVAMEDDPVTPRGKTHETRRTIEHDGK
jgi:hypothetical protein